MRGGIDPGDHLYSSRVVGAEEIRRISEAGMTPILPCMRHNSALLVGEPPHSSQGGAALWSSNQSATLPNRTGDSTRRRVVSTGEILFLFPGLSILRDME